MSEAAPPAASLVEGDRLMAQLAVSQVMTLDERVVTLRDYWSGGPALTCLLRHFGCLFCHQMAHEIARLLPEVRQRGVRVVLIGNGNAAQAQKFFGDHGLLDGDCDLLTDPERGTYKAAGFKRGFGVTFFTKGSIQAYGEARRDGQRITGLKGDLTQLGGLLVTRPPARLVYLHRSEFAGDHPDAGALLAAVEQARG